MQNKECWYQEFVYKNMISDAKKRPLLESHQGQLLKELIDSIEYYRCLDIGCGTGQISELCHEYTGIDLPEIVKNVSWKLYPNAFFAPYNVMVEPIDTLPLYGLVIMSAFIDIMENPIEVLGKILKNCSNYVILHRQEISETKPTQVIQNPSYGGWTWHSIINRNEFDFLIQNFEIIKEVSCKYDNWESGGHSFLLKKRK